ncbi:hybrid sensor histidine kinase/response regulator [Bowmanella dokdonensis]|uniref:histidine kinase n=1 Tax=Bowmanella dokdonensis TaxID=751969 RepID=A0A939IP68_9ALTE|nr:GAF domain-containing hybrid sensor histidine kinase/response regulator [Bowmanella dokdonensis]MBN7825585.1 response regulator [Bowmanella dokdonensis]
MQVAPCTKDENARLRALYDYQILDTEAEKSFDDLTRLASYLCQTPIALISLIDPERQWFKARVGLEVSETPRDLAFCAHAIHGRDVMEVQNALQDPRFADNPLVTGPPNIRFYAGAPLLTPDGHAVGTLCVISDKPHRLSDEQRQGLHVLARSVISQLELRKTVRRLTQVSQYKSDFLSNMSHELRTPLNAILVCSQLLREQLPGITGKPFSDYLEHIHFSAERLLAQINSVLDLSKVEAGKMTLNPVQIAPAEYFHRLHSMMSAQAAEKSLLFELELHESLPGQLLVDMEKLAQILINLLSNAIKFTAPGGRVSTHVYSLDERLEIVVRDTGIGIAPQDQQRIFGRFEQVPGAHAKQGTGLGLAISRSLVELMQGELKLYSEPGVGTQIKVRLPLEQALSPVPQVRPAQPAFALDKQILLVEDDSINQQVARALFASLGLDIHITGSAEQALELVQQSPHFDLIFMDRHLPGMDGLSCCRQLYAQGINAPMVMLSADLHLRDSLAQLPFPALDFLAKPLDKQALIKILNKLIPEDGEN